LNSKKQKAMDVNNVVIAHPKDDEQTATLKAVLKALKIKFEVPKKKPYNKEFVAKILESSKQAKIGKVTRVKKEHLKEFLGV
jgi:hypothetical protein